MCLPGARARPHYERQTSCIRAGPPAAWPGLSCFVVMLYVAAPMTSGSRSRVRGLVTVGSQTRCVLRVECNARCVLRVECIIRSTRSTRVSVRTGDPASAARCNVAPPNACYYWSRACADGTQSSHCTRGGGGGGGSHTHSYHRVWHGRRWGVKPHARARESAYLCLEESGSNWRTEVVLGSEPRIREFAAPLPTAPPPPRPSSSAPALVQPPTRAHLSFGRRSSSHRRACGCFATSST